MSNTMEEGLYVAKIIGQRINESALRKTPYAALHIEIVGRIDLTNPTDPPVKIATTRRTVDLWLTDGAVERSIRDLRAVGWTGRSFAEFDDRAKDFVDVRGKNIFASCRHDDSSTPIREKWSITSAPKPIDTNRLADLDMRFGSLLAEADDDGSDDLTEDGGSPEDHNAVG